MRRATSSISSSSAALAALAVLLVEAALSGGALCGTWFAGRIAPLPHYKFTSMSRYVFLGDCALDACRRAGRPPVIFLGGSPTAALDLPYLKERFGARGEEALLLAYPPSPYPLELLAMQDALLALRPRALVLGLGPPSLAPYEGPRATRLAYFPPKTAALARLPGGPWRHPRLLARAALANLVSAFRFRFMIQDEMFPRMPGRGGPMAQPRRDALFAGAADGLSMTGRDGLDALEAFFVAWRASGVPLIVWDAPRSVDPSLPGRPIPEDSERRYAATMERMKRAGAFRFVTRAEQPRFSAADFVGVIHLKEAASARLTRYLAAEVEKALPPRPATAR